MLEGREGHVVLDLACGGDTLALHGHSFLTPVTQTFLVGEKFEPELFSFAKEERALLARHVAGRLSPLDLLPPGRQPRWPQDWGVAPRPGPIDLV